MAVQLISVGLIIGMVLTSFSMIYRDTLDKRPDEYKYVTLTAKRENNSIICSHKRGEILKNVTIEIGGLIKIVRSWKIGEKIIFRNQPLKQNVVIKTANQCLLWAKI